MKAQEDATLACGVCVREGRIWCAASALKLSAAASPNLLDRARCRGWHVRPSTKAASNLDRPLCRLSLLSPTTPTSIHCFQNPPASLRKAYTTALPKPASLRPHAASRCPSPASPKAAARLTSQVDCWQKNNQKDTVWCLLQALCLRQAVCIASRSEGLCGTFQRFPCVYYFPLSRMPCIVTMLSVSVRSLPNHSLHALSRSGLANLAKSQGQWRRGLIVFLDPEHHGFLPSPCPQAPISSSPYTNPLQGCVQTCLMITPDKSNMQQLL